MKQNEPIRIRLLEGPPKAWISLHGTILAYRDQWSGREVHLDIPIELITISTNKRFMGSRLYGALLSLFLFPLGIAIAWIPEVTGEGKNQTVKIIFDLIGLCLVFGPFFMLLARFLKPQQTVTLTVAPKNGKVTFWVEKKNKNAIDTLLSEITRRQQIVQETIPYPLQTAYGFFHRPIWLKTLVLMFLFSIPALMTEKPWFLLAAMIPILGHIRNIILINHQPRLFRQAFCYYRKKQWNEAFTVLDQLIHELPEYLPAHICLIDVLLRLEKNEDAIGVLENIQSRLDPEKVQDYQLEIIGRKRIADRKKMDIELAEV